MPDAGQKTPILERSAGVARAQSSAVRAMEHIDDVGAGDWSKNSRFKRGQCCVFAGFEFEKVDLEPGSAVELDLEHHRLANQRVE